MDILYKIKRAINRKPVAIYQSKIHRKSKVGDGSQVYRSSIGKYTYVFGSSIIHTNIGNFSSIASGCIIGGGRHPIDWVSTSPIFYRGKNVFKKNFSSNTFEEYLETNIGSDVWIGSNCLIKAGITIGDGAIVGMGAVVTHDIPPYEIWAGNPARFIGKRFDDETIKKLLKLKWWDFNDSRLREIGACFNNIDQFICKCEEFL